MKTLQKSLLIFLGIFSIFVSSCKDDAEELPTPKLELNTSILESTALGFDKPQEILIKSNYDWSFSCPDVDQEWCKLEKTGKQTLSVILEPNPSIEERRTTITIIAGNEKEEKSSTIEIVQNASEKASFVTNPEGKLEMAPMAGSASVAILSNVAGITCRFIPDNVDWCTFEIEDSEIIFTAKANESIKDERKTEVEIIVGVEENCMIDTLLLVQKPNLPFIQVVPDTIHMTPNGEEQLVEITTNVDYTIKTLGDYVTCRQEDNKIWIGAKPYAGKQEMTNQVTFYTGYDGIWARVYVLWPALPEASLTIEGSKDLIFKADGATEERTVYSSLLSWRIKKVEESWVHASKDGDKLIIKVDPSNSETMRTATVVVETGADDNYDYQTFKVTQLGLKPNLIILPEEDIVLSDDGGETKEVIIMTNQDTWDFSLATQEPWCHITREGDKLLISADPLDGGQRSLVVTVTAGVGEKAITKEFKIIQTKPYKIGDYYMHDGKIAGIVFSVSEDGMHGKAIALQAGRNEYSSGMGLPYRVKPSDPTGKLSDMQYFSDIWRCDENNVLGTDNKDGRNNVQVLKNRHSDWKNIFPAAAWCEQLNNASGAPGWYLPAYDELCELWDCWAGGRAEVDPEYGDWNPDTYKRIEASIAEFNKKITDAGGVPLYYDDNDAPSSTLSFIISSTTLFYQGAVNVRILYMTWGWNTSTQWNGDLCNMVGDANTYEVRAIVRF